MCTHCVVKYNLIVKSPEYSVEQSSSYLRIVASLYFGGLGGGPLDELRVGAETPGKSNDNHIIRTIANYHY